MSSWSESQEQALIAAIISRDLISIEQHLARGTNANLRHRHSDTALHLAVLADDDAAVEMLMDYGADALLINDIGQTPGMLAARLGNYALADKLGYIANLGQMNMWADQLPRQSRPLRQDRAF